MAIQQIPKQVLLHAFSYLSLKEALNIKSVSKEWYKLGETAAKPLVEKKFHDMVNRTSSLFQKMTGKTVYEFVPKLNEKLDYSKFTSKTLSNYFETVSLKVYCYIETHYGPGGLILFSSDNFQLRHGIEVKEEKQYVPLTFEHLNEDKYPLCEKDYFQSVIEKKLPLGAFFYFPKELFEINQGEQTAFPLQGRLVICKARQSLRRFEEEMKMLSATRELHDGPSRCYVWERDARSYSDVTKAS